MTIEYDQKGKYYTDVVRKLPVSAVIQTSAHLVRGFVHVKDGERLKNELERDEKFLAVTDATVYGADDEVLYTTSFMAIQRSQIIWIMPAGGDKQEEVNI
ncbi:hypothetical protein [Candidatus Villigracilis saccharophilus]|jgi:hypothetical protein|uniref:DUF6812 domain-containing protein n=1 Tax=Candidatus Villigracilis saccharophilus TaxID=3140684 RepID=UPI0031349D73|nr:hypothetical protein [Anaerolineales bacterium]